MLTPNLRQIAWFLVVTVALGACGNLKFDRKLNGSIIIEETGSSDSPVTPTLQTAEETHEQHTAKQDPTPSPIASPSPSPIVTVDPPEVDPVDPQEPPLLTPPVHIHCTGKYCW